LDVVGGQAFCQGSNGELLAISPAGEVAVRAALPKTTLAAAPLAAGNDLILVGQNGDVLRLGEGASEPQLVATAGQPLTGAVQLIGANLLAGSVNGTLHVLPVTGAAKEEQP
jgi:hypothetical protein